MISKMRIKKTLLFVAVISLASLSAAALPVRTVDPCVVAGPTLPQTLLYLNGSDGKGSQFSNPSQFSYDATQGTLTLSTTFTSGSAYKVWTEAAHVLALDCHTYAQELADESNSQFLAPCLNRVSCSTTTWMDGTELPTSHYGVGTLMPTNPDQADLYARALSHLIVLAQQDYRRRHTASPNDPFAKP
jgi:hypothetical protein